MVMGSPVSIWTRSGPRLAAVIEMSPEASALFVAAARLLHVLDLRETLPLEELLGDVLRGDADTTGELSKSQSRRFGWWFGGRGRRRADTQDASRRR